MPICCARLASPRAMPQNAPPRRSRRLASPVVAVPQTDGVRPLTRSMRTMHGTRKTTPTSVRSPLNPHGPRCSIARLCAEKANPQISAHTRRARNPQRRIVIRGKDMAGIVEAFLRPSNAFGAAGGRVKPIHVPCIVLRRMLFNKRAMRGESPQPSLASDVAASC